MKAIELVLADSETEVLESATPVLIDFWSPTCGPSRAMTPVADRLAEEFDQTAKVMKVNLFGNTELAKKLEIDAVPAFLLFKGGGERGRTFYWTAERRKTGQDDQSVSMKFKFALLMLALLFLSAMAFAKEELVEDIYGGTGDEPVALHVCIPERNSEGTIPALVICPGGGYAMRCSEPEGFGIAKWLNENNIAGFVLDYRLPAGRKNVPLADAQRAIRWVRTHAAEYGVDPNRIGIIGFSAGGHLASSAAVHFDNGNPNSADPAERVSCRPDFALLIYPVITMDSALTHQGTRTELLGKNPTEEDVWYFSSEKQVGAETPPVFLAHAQDDTVVPPENSVLFSEKMKAWGRPCVYLELESGGHGLNGYKGTSWDRWQRDAAEWIKKQ